MSYGNGSVKLPKPLDFVIGEQKFQFTFDRLISAEEAKFRERQHHEIVWSSISAKASPEIHKYLTKMLEQTNKYRSKKLPKRVLKYFVRGFDSIYQLDEFRKEHPHGYQHGDDNYQDYLRQKVMKWKHEKFVSFPTPTNTIKVSYTELVKIFGEGRKNAIQKEETVEERSEESEPKSKRRRVEPEIEEYLPFAPLMQRFMAFSDQEDEVKEKYRQIYEDDAEYAPFDSWVDSRWQENKFREIKDKFNSLLGNEEFENAIVANFKVPEVVAA